MNKFFTLVIILSMAVAASKGQAFEGGVAAGLVGSQVAGDTYSGAIAVAITEKMDWENAIKFAVEAASISVTRLGAQASIPFKKDIVL